MSGDLFAADAGAAAKTGSGESGFPPSTPLADRMRPRSLDEVEGPEAVVGANGFLRRAVAEDRVPSLILWGPPGVGKTTLARLIATQTSALFLPYSAVATGVKEMREVLEEAAPPARAAGQAHDPLPRRDPPVQPLAAGRVPALRRGGRHRPRRGHDREPFLRAERRPALALQGRRAGAAGARGDRADRRARAAGHVERGLGARDFAVRTTTPSRSSRSSRAATRGARSNCSRPPRPAADGRPGDRRIEGDGCGTCSSARSCSTTRPAKSTTT